MNEDRRTTDVLHRLWNLPVESRKSGTTFHLVWNAIAVAAIGLAPLRLGYPGAFWTAPATELGAAVLFGSAFLAYALFLSITSHRDGSLRLPAALVGAAVCFGSTLAVTQLRPEIHCSSVACLTTAIAGPPLALFPYLVGSYHAVSFVALALLVGVGATTGSRSRPTTENAARVKATAIKVLSITYDRNLVDASPRDGGAIERFGDSLLLVTGDGTFYRLSPGGNGAKLTSRRIPLTPPVTAEQFRAIQQNQPNAKRLRVTDMVLSQEEPFRLFVAHQYWNSAERCFTMRVSVAAVDRQLLERTASDEIQTDWTTLFESSPCLSASAKFSDVETGGRLAWLGKDLLLTIGDHGFDGIDSQALAQGDDNSYGKVLLIHGPGQSEVFTKGHRNPQGLLVDDRQQVWITEHGPQGGDELNLLERGRNYGWPAVTYGTDYGRRYWPLAPVAHNHGDFAEPVHAFVPSIGVSNLLQVDSKLFPEWKSDFLVASLRPETLYRIRLLNNRVTYVEPIVLRRQIRDLVQASDGRIYMWTDEREIVTVAPGPSAPVGAVVYDTCRSCHEPSESGPPVGPSLRGVVGRRVASVRDYKYSAAMSQLGGQWTEERLDAFLANPNGYVGGTDMSAGAIAAPAERKALIEFLKSYR